MARSLILRDSSFSDDGPTCLVTTQREPQGGGDGGGSGEKGERPTNQPFEPTASLPHFLCHASHLLALVGFRECWKIIMGEGDWEIHCFLHCFYWNDCR